MSNFNVHSDTDYIQKIFNTHSLIEHQNNNIIIQEKNNDNDIFFSGDIKYSVRSNDHGKWILCDGRELSRTDYIDLFSIINTSFGEGNKIDTFNIPNTLNKLVGCIGDKKKIGEDIGSEEIILEIENLPSHSHKINDPGHTHTFNPAGMWYFSGSMKVGSNGVYPAEATGSINYSQTGISLENTGANKPFSLYPPTLFLGNIFIHI